jgi:hypothetical protein
MQVLKIKLVRDVPAVSYTEAFKRQVIREYERGGWNKEDLQKKYGKNGKSRLLDWCRKYGLMPFRVEYFHLPQ